MPRLHIEHRLMHKQEIGSVFKMSKSGNSIWITLFRILIKHIGVAKPQSIACRTVWLLQVISCSTWHRENSLDTKFNEVQTFYVTWLPAGTLCTVIRMFRETLFLLNNIKEVLFGLEWLTLETMEWKLFIMS